SSPIRVNDDPANPIRSQFLPKIAVNSLSSDIGICWHDARNSGTNTAMQIFCTIATRLPATPVFMANAQISDGASTSNGAGIEFGDYSGLAYFQGLMHPAWADTSNSGGLNPDGNAGFDAYTDRVTGGAAAMEGDPHITTVDNIHYDFQGGGEFISLRDGDGSEIQTRQTPIPTAPNPGTNPYTGLSTCVSLNTAVAARVGAHRVTYQPNLSGNPDPSGLQLRVDGDLTTLAANGVDLDDGGRILRNATNGVEIDFPNGTILNVTPGWWASQSKWYLNVDVLRTPSVEGLMGALMPGSWLPALPDGSSLGTKPAAPHQRYVELYEKFGNAWRVTDRTSLFDYAPGTSTDTFTNKNWPPENGSCTLPNQTAVTPGNPRMAALACREVTDKGLHADCLFDVAVTGNTGFAKTYILTQKQRVGTTVTTVSDDPDPSQPGEWVTFVAAVSRNVSREREVPTGTVQFMLDGQNEGQAVQLDSTGRARWETSRLRVGKHRISARYIPRENSVFLPSSGEDLHLVRRCACESSVASNERR
ncbi:MAG: Ig-like domain repeat protein, partial [Terriglobales bacterium]